MDSSLHNNELEEWKKINELFEDKLVTLSYVSLFFNLLTPSP